MRCATTIYLQQAVFAKSVPLRIYEASIQQKAQK